MSVRLLGTGLLAAAALVLTACSSSGGSATTPPAASNGPSNSGGSSVVLSTGSTGKGTVLTEDGRTLYTFDPDTATSSACSGGCASVWPPVIGTAVLASGLPGGDFGHLTRSDGSRQVTYRGHPVYEFSGDTKAGDTKGDGVDGTWHVAVVPASGAPSSPVSSGGGGYTY